MRLDLPGFGDGEDLDEETIELYDTIMCTPRMAVARTDNEAEPPISIRGRIEIAYGVNDMVEAAGHQIGTFTNTNRDYFIAENAVGVSS